MDKKVIFLTNNATKTPETFIKKLNGMNIECKPNQLMSSGIIASKMLHEQLGLKKIFVIGTEALVGLMELAGLETLNTKISPNILYADWLDKSILCDAVVIAMDIKVTYEKIRTAQELINRGAEFYATNGDKTFPESKQIWPGAGMIVAAVEATVGRSPKIIFGKPNPIGIDLIFNELNKDNQNYDKEDAVIIGDRLETDILQANRAKVDSVLVETGIHRRKDIPKNILKDTKDVKDVLKTTSDTFDKNLVPKYILNNLMDLFE